MNSEVNIKRIDWISVAILSLLVLLGLGNIYSSSQAYLLESIFSMNPFTKQLLFAIISIFIFLFIQIFLLHGDDGHQEATRQSPPAGALAANRQGAVFRQNAPSASFCPFGSHFCDSFLPLLVQNERSPAKCQ